MLQQSEKELVRTGYERGYPLTSDLKNGERREWRRKPTRVDHRDEDRASPYQTQNEFWDDSTKQPGR